MKHYLIFLIITAATFLSIGCQSTNKNNMDATTVKELNLDNYLGTWYEIARFNHSFEKGLVGVTATYNIRPDGKIEVINKGFKNSLDGELSIATGKAKIPDNNYPGKLKVSFFLFFYADYNVLELGKNYEWALVGSSSDKYLWILSRTPQIDADLYNSILKLAQKRGYNTDDLIVVEQKKSENHKP